MHAQGKEGDIRTHQNHYIPRLSAFALPKNVDLESNCSEGDLAAYISVLGGVAWIANTRADVAVFVGAFQCVAKCLKYIDLKRLNTVLKLIKKHPVTTIFKRLTGALRVVAISDSAFKRQDESPLACRGSMIVPGTDDSTNEAYTCWTTSPRSRNE